MRRRFSGEMYLTLEQTQMAARAHWINEWLDNAEVVYGSLSRHDPDDPVPTDPEYASVDEALKPDADRIWCRFKDGKEGYIYGYKRGATFQ